MEEGASPPRWALDKKLGEDASMEEKKEEEKERGGSTKLKEEKEWPHHQPNEIKETHFKSKGHSLSKIHSTKYASVRGEGQAC